MSISEVSGIEAAATPAVQGPYGWEVKVTLLGADKTAFMHLTSITVHQELAIVVGGNVLSAPQTMEPITTGTLEITGFTYQSADNLISNLTGK